MRLRPTLHLSRRRIMVAVALLGSLAGIAVVTPSWAGTKASYAALGDSYSSGVGTGTYDPNDPCQRSALSADALWSTGHHDASFAFAACSGATTTDVINNQVGVLNADTTLVTITIGGNDAGFVPVLHTCVLENDEACMGAVNQAEAYVTTILPGQLDATYAAIHAKAPKAQLIVLGYPRLFNLTEPCDSSGMNVYRRGLLNHAGDLLIQMTNDRAYAAGATFVDVRPAFTGHEVCSADPWINGITSPITDSFHPNRTGYSAGYLPALLGVTG